MTNKRADSRGADARWRWLFWETLIIVLGVLIAFAVNDYWADRQDRALELQYLKRIHEDLLNDHRWVSRYSDGPMPRKMAALNAIAPVVRGHEAVPEDIETFLRNVMLGAIGGASPNYFVTATTFEDMKATGNLRLIRNTDLRGKLNQYYVNYDNQHTRLNARTTGYFMFVHSLLPSELRNDIDYDAINDFGIERSMDRVLSEEFRDLMNQELNYGYFADRMFQTYVEVTKEMADEVKAYILTLDPDANIS